MKQICKRGHSSRIIYNYGSECRICKYARQSRNAKARRRWKYLVMLAKSLQKLPLPLSLDGLEDLNLDTCFAKNVHFK